jgi:hypothetical protein
MVWDIMGINGRQWISPPKTLMLRGISRCLSLGAQASAEDFWRRKMAAVGSFYVLIEIYANYPIFLY